MNVIIIGAGFAGLTAAYTLKNEGFDVTVLEARERVGGRAWSPTLENGAVVEMGGEWVEASDRTFRDLASQLDIKLAPVGVDFMLRQVFNGPAVRMSEQQAILRIAIEALDALDEATINQQTIADFLTSLDLSDPERNFMRARIQSTFGMDLAQVALRDLIGEFGLEIDTKYFRVIEGNQTMAVALAGRIADIRVLHQVQRVEYDEHDVFVHGQRGDQDFMERADAAIIAVPVRAIEKLNFQPNLPEALTTAIEKIPMGVAAKLSVGTERPPTLRNIQDVQSPFSCYTGNGANRQPRSAVTSFAGSAQAMENLNTASGDPATWLNLIQEANPDLTFVGEPQMYHWGLDPYTEGCYTAMTNEAHETLPLLSEPVGRLTFAGEHTNGSGTMNGAMESGLAAARRIKQMLS